ncbi:MAG: hypothetical protein K6T29_02155 [Peptococcaceae bacterium]|nr:hypothetical protein [Peptococcaceae bacterium]
MAHQLLQNNGFENELENYITQGSVSTNNNIACEGKSSALLLATPTAIAELSQVVFSIAPGAPVNFSFSARRFHSQDTESVSNFRAEVNFISPLGTVIPSGIVIKGRGRDISENVWKRYNGYAVAPFGTVAAQVVIRLEPPESGTSGLLVDNLELVSETTMPAAAPAPAFPLQPGIPAFPGFPYTQPSPSPASFAQQQTPAFPGAPFANTLFPGLPFTGPAFPGPPFTNPAFSGLPFANQALPGMPPANTVFPGLPFTNPPFPGLPFTNLMFPGLPFPNMAPPAPAPQVQQANPLFPGGPSANLSIPPELLYPGSPLAHLLFPGSLFNTAPKAPDAQKKPDRGQRPAKGGSAPEPEKNQK